MAKKKKIYKDFDDWWSNGRHGYSSASRDIAEEIWADLHPTISAGRDDYTKLMLLEIKEMRERYIEQLQDTLKYLRAFNLEAVAGIKYFRWLLDQKLRRKSLKRTCFYKYKDREYSVIREVKLKDSSTGKWLDAYEYIDRESPITVYVREKKDFEKRFMPISKVKKVGRTESH